MHSFLFLLIYWYCDCTFTRVHFLAVSPRVNFPRGEKGQVYSTHWSDENVRRIVFVAAACDAEGADGSHVRQKLAAGFVQLGPTVAGDGPQTMLVL